MASSARRVRAITLVICLIVAHGATAQDTPPTPATDAPSSTDDHGSMHHAGMHLLIWLGVFFTSILIHELGHAFMIQHFGRPAHIVLYAMGGLAIEGRPRDFGSGSPWSFDTYTGFQPRQRTPLEQILISAAGPGIQFALLGVVVAAVYATGGSVEMEMDGLVPYLMPKLGGELGKNPNLFYLSPQSFQLRAECWPGAHDERNDCSRSRTTRPTTSR